MQAESIDEQLASLGISETEARTYRVVVEHGAATVATIATEADLSRVHVYKLIESLAEQGFVEVFDHVTPTKVRANPPSEVFEDLKADIDDIVFDLEKRWSKADPEQLSIEIHKSRPKVVDRLRAIISDAEGEVILSIPELLLSELEAQLGTAYEKGVVVVLHLWHVDPDELTDDRFDGLATVVRASPYWGPLLLTIDFNRTGLLPPEHIFVTPQTEFLAIEAHEPMPVYVMRAALLAQEWPAAREVYVRDPVDLPWKGRWFSAVTINATSHFRAGTDLWARIDAREIHRTLDDGVAYVPREGGFETIEVPVVDTRQRFLDPLTNEHPVENALVVEHEGEEITIGGTGAYLEDYEARSVELLEAER